MTHVVTTFSRRFYNTTTESHVRMVGGVLMDRGLQWQPVKVEIVQFNSHSISFEEEWKKFIDRISAITKINPESTHSNSRPWEHFEHVLSRSYNSENAFSDVLFTALRTSLSDFIVPTISKANLIALKNSPARFGKGISRGTLGFPVKYALSEDSISDHSCFVTGTSLTTLSPYKKDTSSNMRSEKESWYNDLTAVVEIKLDRTICTNFAVDTDSYIAEPDLKKKSHRPIGQAILYTLDALHCLARRGQVVTNLPVVLLAGKSNEPGDMDLICCLEAQIEVPEYCGDAFTYSVQRLVTFNGITGLDKKEAFNEDLVVSLKDSRDKRAIAIYIRTLRRGLECALQVINSRNMSSSIAPVSLCCQRLLPGVNNAQLVASPIPRENHLWQSGLSISQGELFRLASPTIDTFSRLAELQWFVDTLPKHCLVKVSCAMVHNTSIDHGDCNQALTVLYTASKNNEKLKQEISKVLLGFCSTGVNKSLITIMKDLHAGPERFEILDHEELAKQGMLPQLWSGFCVLVKSLLLPMANLKVIHLDIRSNNTHTYNILVNKSPGCGGKSADAIVLNLIDYDSLVVSDTTFGTKQDHAVYWGDLVKLQIIGKGRRSAHRYLLWQVLWIAYTWHPQSPKVSMETLQKELNASTFVHSLFDDNYYFDFKSWLGIDTVEALKLSLMAETITEKTVKEALNLLQVAFRDISNE